LICSATLVAEADLRLLDDTLERFGIIFDAIEQPGVIADRDEQNNLVRTSRRIAEARIKIDVLTQSEAMQH
jgi:hypothetical protein